MRYVDANRAAAARDFDNLQLHDSLRAALDHALRDGPVPAFLQSADAKAEAANAGARVIDERDIPGLEKHFTPIAQRDVEGLVTRAVVVGQVERKLAHEVANFCLAAQLPQFVSEAVIDRFAKHTNEGWGLGKLSEADTQELAFECAHAFGSAEKAYAEIELGRKYLEKVGGKTLLEYFDTNAGSLAADPKLILQLSMMARARGIT